MPEDIKSVGVLGLGKVGTAIARQAMKGGYEVLLATDKPPAEIALIAEVLAPGAVAMTAAELMRRADIVVLAIPLAKYRSLDAAGLAGKIVIDIMNYWQPTDGTLEEFESASPSSVIVQRHLSGARLVRTLNHIGYHELEENALPVGHPDRQALALAGDDASARQTVAKFIDRLGYDVIDAGPLANSVAFQIGTPIFGARLDRNELKALLPVVSSGCGRVESSLVA